MRTEGQLPVESDGRRTVGKVNPPTDSLGETHGTNDFRGH